MRPREITVRVLSADLSGVNGRRDPAKPDRHSAGIGSPTFCSASAREGVNIPPMKRRWPVDAKGRSGASTSNPPLSVRVAFDPSGHKRSATACGLGEANSAERYRFFSSRQPWSSTNVPSIAAAP
jgi:hypothetical protein